MTTKQLQQQIKSLEIQKQHVMNQMLAAERDILRLEGAIAALTQLLPKPKPEPEKKNESPT